VVVAAAVVEEMEAAVSARVPVPAVVWASVQTPSRRHRTPTASLRKHTPAESGARG